MNYLAKKQCYKCSFILPIENFHKDKSRKDGYKDNCKNCRKLENPERSRSYSIDYYKKNSEEIKRKARENYPAYKDYRISHNRIRRALKTGVFSDNSSDMDVLSAYGNCCYLCGFEIDLTAPRKAGINGWENGLHIDHVVGIALGGNDTIDNLRPTHGLCNLRKSKKVLS